MMYFNALLNGLHVLPASNPSVRADIEKQAKEEGWAEMHNKLKEVDPQSAKRIHPNDPQRLQRRLKFICYLEKRCHSTLKCRSTSLIYPLK